MTPRSSGFPDFSRTDCARQYVRRPLVIWSPQQGLVTDYFLGDQVIDRLIQVLYLHDDPPFAWLPLQWESGPLPLFREQERE
jgi:hypothetical protein